MTGAVKLLAAHVKLGVAGIALVGKLIKEGVVA